MSENKGETLDGCNNAGLQMTRPLPLFFNPLEFETFRMSLLTTTVEREIITMISFVRIATKKLPLSAARPSGVFRGSRYLQWPLGSVY